MKEILQELKFKKVKYQTLCVSKCEKCEVNGYSKFA
jgi:hypothetical protein